MLLFIYKKERYMIKKINRKNILITFFAFLLIILLSVSYIPFSSFADENETAEQDQNSQKELQKDNLIVQAYNREDSLISLENPIDYSGGKAYTINWTDLKEFSIFFLTITSNKLIIFIFILFYKILLFNLIFSMIIGV